MYLTTYVKEKFKQTPIAYTEIMQTPTKFEEPKYYKTTVKIEDAKSYDNQYIATVARYIRQIYYEILFPFKNNYEEEYYIFQIPKKSGGLRTISAPNTAFKDALSKTKDIFEHKIKCLPHKAAYAYIKNLSVYDAIKQHQNNNSNWFLKIDLKDFFPSCNPELIYNQLIKLFPFYHLAKEFKDLLRKIIEICCLHDGLPQGTPMSPILTNLLMVPYDYEIYKYLTRGTGEHYVYTRYADDILISSKSTFDWRKIQEELEQILKPFKINKTKTRYGSRAGSNWNLGLMLNSNNNITIGHTKKKTLNAMLNNLLRDYADGKTWPHEDIYVLQGKIGQLAYIEPDYCAYIIDKYEKKYDISYKSILKQI